MCQGGEADEEEDEVGSTGGQDEPGSAAHELGTHLDVTCAAQLEETMRRLLLRSWQPKLWLRSDFERLLLLQGVNDKLLSLKG